MADAVRGDERLGAEAVWDIYYRVADAPVAARMDNGFRISFRNLVRLGLVDDGANLLHETDSPDEVFVRVTPLGRGFLDACEGAREHEP